MELALSFSAADAARIEKYAAEKSMSAIDFVKNVLKTRLDEEDARAEANEEYLAMLDRSRRQIEKGQTISFTEEEWEKFVNGDPEVCAAKKAEHLALQKRIAEEEAAEEKRMAFAE